MPPSGDAHDECPQRHDGVQGSTDPQLAIAGRHDHQHQGAGEQHDDQGGEAERERAAFREGDGEHDDRCRARGEAPARWDTTRTSSASEDRGAPGDREEAPGDRAGQRRRQAERCRQPPATPLCGKGGEQGGRQPECEREAADGQVGDGSSGEEQRRRPTASPRHAEPCDQALERDRSHDRRDQPDRRRTDERPEWCEQRAVTEGVVPAVPGGVPDREAHLPEAGDAEQVGRCVGAAPVERVGEDRHRGGHERGRRRARQCGPASEGRVTVAGMEGPVRHRPLPYAPRCPEHLGPRSRSCPRVGSRTPRDAATTRAPPQRRMPPERICFHRSRSRSSAGRPTRVTTSTSGDSARSARTVHSSRGRCWNGSNW